MPDYIGNVPVPEIAPSGTFPLVPEYPYGVARAPEVVIHAFGSGNAKIEQRFLLGTGTRQFIIRKAWLRDSERIALRNFWETKYGPYGAFTYNAPSADGVGTTPIICRFANEPLSWEMVSDWACSLGVTLIEVPTTTPTCPLNQTVHRFPPASLQTAGPGDHPARADPAARTWLSSHPSFRSPVRHRRATLPSPPPGI